jgi:hypothetical protein
MASQAQSWFGTLLMSHGDYGGARQRLDAGLTQGRLLGDRLAICNALFNLGQLALSLGKYDEPADWFGQGIAPSLETGDRPNGPTSWKAWASSPVCKAGPSGRPGCSGRPTV